MMDTNKLLKDGEGKNFIYMGNYSDWANFFLIFSRFEYALKRSGYAKGSSGWVKADWLEFGKEVEDKFNTQQCEELRDAVKYLKNSPPKKQILKDGQLDWDCPREDEQEILRLINAIKRVRNNLFHGGKYPSMPVTDSSRDRELIKNSIIVLKHLLYSSRDVKEKYFEPLE